MVNDAVSFIYHSTPVFVLNPFLSLSVSLVSFKNALGSLPLKYSVFVFETPGDSL